MSDPYKEAVRGERGSGPSPLAWFGIIVGGFFLLGLVAMVGMGVFVFKTASDVAADFRENPVGAFADLAEFLDDDIEVVATDEEAGTVTLKVRENGELVTVDLSEVGEWLGGDQDGRVRFDGEADESGGVLRIRTSEGETRIELRGDDEGGFLKIVTPEDEVRLGAGSSAAGLPRWVPVYPGARVQKRLFSADTEEGTFGAAFLETSDDPSDVLDWYAETLADEGFRSSVSRIHVDDGDVRGRIEWVSNDEGDRGLSVVVGVDDGEGFILLLHRMER